MYIQQGQHIDGFRVVGINYKKSDAAVRGQFAVNQDQYARLLATAKDYNITDFFVLSTCNRTEIYGFADSDEQMIQFIASVCAGNETTFSEIAYSRSGEEAIAHLYHVAAGLDSQILGDYEILGQIKCAVKLAKAAGRIGAFMERLINSVLQASKAVKTNTELSGGTVSVSFAAIQFIKEYLGLNVPDTKEKIANHKIVLIGTGKIGRVTCRNMVDYLHTRNITLINRTEETATVLAGELGLSAAPLSSLEAEIADASIVVVSTNAPDPVVLGKHVHGKGKKLIIDISVPCNVALDAQADADVKFVDVDMLSRVKDETLQKRRDEVPVAMAIIAEHIREFKQWCAMRKHVPVLIEVKNKLMGIPVDPVLLGALQQGKVDSGCSHDEKVHKAISNLATRMRNQNAPGCHYIQAINDYIA